MVHLLQLFLYIQVVLLSRNKWLPNFCFVGDFDIPSRINEATSLENAFQIFCFQHLYTNSSLGLLPESYALRRQGVIPTEGRLVSSVRQQQRLALYPATPPLSLYHTLRFRIFVVYSCRPGLLSQNSSSSSQQARHDYLYDSWTFYAGLPQTAPLSPLVVALGQGSITSQRQLLGGKNQKRRIYTQRQTVEMNRIIEFHPRQVETKWDLEEQVLLLYLGLGLAPKAPRPTLTRCDTPEAEIIVNLLGDCETQYQI